MSEPKAKGKNDGSVQRKEYFKCAENSGIFVDHSQIPILQGVPTSLLPPWGLLTCSSIGGVTSIPLPSSMRREKVDTALGVEETVETLTDKNRKLKEEIVTLRENEAYLNALVDLDKGIEGSYLQAEHDLKEELEMKINKVCEMELKLKTTQETNGELEAKLQKAQMDLNKQLEENHCQTERDQSEKLEMKNKVCEMELKLKTTQETNGELEAKLQAMVRSHLAGNPVSLSEFLSDKLKIFTVGTECATIEIERLKQYSKDCDEGSAFGDLVQEMELRNVKIQQLCRQIQEPLIECARQQSLVLKFCQKLTTAVSQNASSLANDENLLSGQLDELASDVAVLVFETDEVPCKDIVSHTLDEVISFLSSFVTKIQEGDHDAEPKEESKVMAAANTSDKKIAQALRNQGGTQKRQRKDEVENETAAKAKRRRSGSDTVARLSEANDLAQKWKMKEMLRQKQRLEAESEKKEQSKKQHEDLMQVLLQQTKQQQEQMENYMQMFTSMYKQQSQITRKLLEKQN